MALRQYTAGYKVGKLAQALLNKSPDMFRMTMIGELCALVYTFKEPIQSLLPIIMDHYKSTLKVRVSST